MRHSWRHGFTVICQILLYPQEESYQSVRVDDLVYIQISLWYLNKWVKLFSNLPMILACPLSWRRTNYMLVFDTACHITLFGTSWIVHACCAKRSVHVKLAIKINSHPVRPCDCHVQFWQCIHVIILQTVYMLQSM